MVKKEADAIHQLLRNEKTAAKIDGCWWGVVKWVDVLRVLNTLSSEDVEYQCPKCGVVDCQQHGYFIRKETANEIAKRKWDEYCLYRTSKIMDKKHAVYFRDWLDKEV